MTGKLKGEARTDADVALRQLPMNSTRASQAACDRTRHLTCSCPERAKCRVNTSGNIIDPNDRIRASERLTSDTRHRIGGALSPPTSHPTYCLEPATLSYSRATAAWSGPIRRFARLRV
jgi:hypothetical protein